MNSITMLFALHVFCQWINLQSFHTLTYLHSVHKKIVPNRSAGRVQKTEEQFLSCKSRVVIVCFFQMQGLKFKCRCKLRLSTIKTEQFQFCNPFY